MVKFVVFCTKAIATITVAALFSSCHANVNWGDDLDGSGFVKTETRNVGNNFSKIEAKRGLNVVLEQSGSYAVEVEADDNLLEHIKTTVENGTLIITTDENIGEAKAKNVRVKMPLLTGIEASSGSSLSTTGVFTGEEITVKSSSGSESNVNLEFDNIKCDASSGSTIVLKGKALNLSTESSSGSSIDASGLIVNDVVAQASSGSSTDVHPMVSLKGKASSGSSIDYDSSPQTVTKEESSGGSVSKE